MMTFVTRSPEETIELGKSFASSLKPGDIVAIFGNLGTGKTLFVKGVCQGLRVRDRVTSPTFTIVNEYSAPRGGVVHIDLYRINSSAELTEIGIESYFDGERISLIEWAEGALSLLPRTYHTIKLKYGGAENEREIEIGMKEEVFG